MMLRSGARLINRFRHLQRRLLPIAGSLHDIAARNSSPTPWTTVGLLYLAGVFAASQVGKAIATVPQIRTEMHLSMSFAGALLSIFATLGAVGGIAGGAVVSTVGARRSLLFGLFSLAAGNAFAVAATDPFALLLARALEGCGFFGVVLATPSLLSRVVASEDRDLVMGLWSAYMPLGVTVMLLLCPALPETGWRQLWSADAALGVLLAPILHQALPRAAQANLKPQMSTREIASVLNNRCCVLMACAFFAYSFQFFSLAFLLPMLFTSLLGYSLGTSTLFGAAAMGVSAIGHLASGPLLRARFPIWTAIALTFAVYGVAVVGIFSASLPALAVGVLAAFALGIGGLAPGAFYSSAPRVAPTPEALPTTIGLFQQASNLGQFAGPMIVAMVIQQFGWESEPIVAMPIALGGLGIAFAIRKYVPTAASVEIVSLEPRVNFKEDSR
jgi:predicted MFS family arabinose efflux permease